MEKLTKRQEAAWVGQVWGGKEHGYILSAPGGTRVVARAASQESHSGERARGISNSFH